MKVSSPFTRQRSSPVDDIVGCEKSSSLSLQKTRSTPTKSSSSTSLVKNTTLCDSPFAKHQSNTINACTNAELCTPYSVEKKSNDDDDNDKLIIVSVVRKEDDERDEYGTSLTTIDEDKNDMSDTIGSVIVNGEGDNIEVRETVEQTNDDTSYEQSSLKNTIPMKKQRSNPIKRLGSSSISLGSRLRSSPVLSRNMDQHSLNEHVTDNEQGQIKAETPKNDKSEEKVIGPDCEEKEKDADAVIHNEELDGKSKVEESGNEEDVNANVQLEDTESPSESLQKNAAQQSANDVESGLVISVPNAESATYKDVSNDTSENAKEKQLKTKKKEMMTKKKFGLTKKSSTKASGFEANFLPSELPKTNPSTWPHNPVFVRAGSSMEAVGIANDQPLPLGVPFEVDSSLFKGKVLLRFRNTKSDHPTSHTKYFANRKRLMQTVVQGQFKRNISMADVYTGSLFAHPWAASPPPTMAKIMTSIISKVAPGLIMDMTSQSPKILALLAGASQAMRIDDPGNEPDMMDPYIQENVLPTLGKGVSTVSKRRKILGNPKKAAAFEFTPDKVYTFENFDDAMDYGNGTMKIPYYGDVDIKQSVGKQPLSLTAVTKDGEIVYDVRVWHQSHYQDKEEDKESDALPVINMVSES